jgi:hypothetical protein
VLEYVVGGGILVGGSIFAAFNGLMSARDDLRREREEELETAAARVLDRTRPEEMKQVA